MAELQFHRLWNNKSPVRPLVSSDGRFLILEVFADTSAYSGFRVYDTHEGELIEEDFPDVESARRYVNEVA